MPHDPKDAEIIALIARSYGLTFSEIADEVARRFGPDRAWPVYVIADYVHRHRRRLFASPFQRDGQVMAFIADRTDLMSIAEIRRQGVATFGADRFPSTSAIHRLFLNVRRDARQSTLATPPATEA